MALIVVALGFAFIALERWRPARPLPTVPGWWPRAIALNAAQLGMVFVGAMTWDRWFGVSLFDFAQLGLMPSALLGYLVTTFIYYGWHRARHASNLLWRLCHQLHHAPARLEVITAFHKHPLEIALNGLLSSAITYGLLGLSVEAAAIVTLFCGVAEFFYHWNVKTPHWLGYLIQRPEMHRIHHERGQHRKNYGDLPIWDLLFGTFENPREREVECGFEPAVEARVGEMLRFVDVHQPARPGRGRRFGLALLLSLGLLQMAGAAVAHVFPGIGETLAGLGRLTVASPNPKVFTRVGDQEPFAFSFALEVERGGRTEHIGLNGARYGRVPGPYMYRNVYGAMLAFADFLPAETVDAVLRHGLCNGGHLTAALDAGPPVERFTVITTAPGTGPAPRTLVCRQLPRPKK